jgi:hypothetical protein
VRKLVRILILGLLAVFCTASIASATPYEISFGDDTIYWEGWQSPQSSDNFDDDIGTPLLLGGRAIIDEISGIRTLTKLEIDAVNASGGIWAMLAPGDLFLDTDPTTEDVWNLVVDLTEWETSAPYNTDPGEGNYNMYEITLPLSGSDYISSGSWSGYNIRDDHPVAASGITYGDTNLENGYIGEVHFSGWGDIEGDPYGSPYVFDFTVDSSPGIPLYGDFTFGWTTNCANDVLYETVNPVPEPATMLLLGTGLIGLAGIGRKKLGRNKK